MATVSAPDHRSSRIPATTESRHYWQLPTFFLGVTAAIASFLYFPPPPTDPAVAFQRDVVALRAAIEQRGINPLTQAEIAQIAAATSQITALADRFPELANAAHFAAATGYIFLADHGPAEEMTENWLAAAEQLSRVDVGQLTDPEEQKRFQFRQAKVTAALGEGDPLLLLGPLSNPPIGEDDGGERSRLLAEVALRLNPPDLKRARVELAAYLAGPPRLKPEDLARLKLQLADIHIRLKEPEKSRPWLTDLARLSAPVDLVAEARQRLAKLAAAEKQWEKAREYLESAAMLPDLSPDRLAAIEYEAGLTLLRMNRLPEARRWWEQAAMRSGPEAAAAAIRLAEQIALDPSAMVPLPEAVALLERAVPVQTVPPVVLPALSDAEIQAAFEIVIRKSLSTGEFPTAMRGIAAFARIGTPARVRELRAEALGTWATVAEKQGDNSSAKARHREAAQEYSRLAAMATTPSGQGDSLRRAIGHYRQAGDQAAAIRVIEQLVAIPSLPPELAAAAWLNQGEILLERRDYTAAENLLKKAIATSGPVAVAARVKLGLAHLEQASAKRQAASTPEARAAIDQQLKFGQELLAQVANTASADDPAIREARLQALFELGKLLLKQGSLVDAESRFRQMLQFAPQSPQAPMAKLYLGSCLLLLARGDHQGGRPPADAARKLAEARTLFEELADTPDPFLQAQADVRLANTTLLLKKFDELPSLCNRLAEKYQGKVEEIIVLSMLYSAYRFMDRNADANRTLDRMEAAFGKLTEADFPGGAEEYTREYWQTQWFAVLKPATPATPPSPQ